MIQKINNNSVYISVDTHGSELRSLCDVHGVEHLWQGGDKWLGQSPVIFPIVSKTQNGNYIYDGKEYTMPLHGFAASSDFKVAEKRSDLLVLRLTDNAKTREMYPFKFTLDMRYELHDNSLTVRYVVTNNDEKPMPFALGGHPGFRVPLEEDEKFEDYYLKFDSAENVTLMLKRIGTEGEKKPVVFLDGTDRWQLQHDIFHCGVLVLDNLKSRGVNLCSSVSGRGLRMEYEDFDILSVWQQNDADFLCLEPWTSANTCAAPNEKLENILGMRILAAGETADFKYTVTFI